MSTLPIDRVCVADRLYLFVDTVNCMDATLPAMAIGIFVDDREKRAAMANATWLQPALVHVDDGRGVQVERTFGVRAQVSNVDIIQAQAAFASARLKQQDMTRFF